MRKIFFYECRRLLCNKFFLGLLLVILFYGWQVLNRVTIFGIAHTAPYSPWSFGDYLCRMLPLLWMGALFFLSFFSGKAEARRKALTAATPVNPAVYSMVRCSAAFVGTALVALVVILLALVFYGRLFHWAEWRLYLWMLFPVVWIALPLPDSFGLVTGSAFVERPLALNTLDPAFSLLQGTIICQCALFFAGTALLFLHPKNRRS